MKRKSYLTQVVNYIHENSDYCLMNEYKKLPDATPTDLDIAINIPKIKLLDEFVYSMLKQLDLLLVNRVWHSYQRCAYMIASKNGDFMLELDFFYDFSMKGFPKLIPFKFIANHNKRTYMGYKVPNTDLELLFLLIRRFIKNDFDEDKLNFAFYLLTIDRERNEALLSSYFGKKSAKEIIASINEKNLNALINKAYKYRWVLKRKTNNILRLDYLMKFYMRFIVQAIKRFIKQDGIVLHFYGTSSIERCHILGKVNMLKNLFHGIEVLNMKDSKRTMLTKIILNKAKSKLTLVFFDNRKKPIKSRFAYNPDIVIYKNLEKYVVRYNSSTINEHCISIDRLMAEIICYKSKKTFGTRIS